MLRTRLIAGRNAALIMSAVFAIGLTATAEFASFVPSLSGSEAGPAAVSVRLPPGERVEVQQTGVRVTVPPRRFAIGSTLSANDAQRVRFWESRTHARSPERLLSLWALFFVLAVFVTTYLRSFTPGRGALFRTQAGILGLMAIVALLSKALLLFTDLPDALLPVGAVGLWVAMYLSRRSGLMVGALTAALLALLAGGDLVNGLAFGASALTAVVVLGKRRRPQDVMLAGLLGGLAAAVVVAAGQFALWGQDPITDIMTPLRSEVLGALVGGILSTLLTLALTPLAVRMLGTVSRARLLSLSDLSEPLLRKMAEEAPGSWEHARAMANLAEAAADAIGADSLLTRVGAYYHDLGKTIQPKYFVENLEEGEVSPHAALEPGVSADAIMAHVVGGAGILRRGGIPEAIVEFAYTHHGTSIIEYFWHKCLEAGNPHQLSETHFRYPGMRPRTKETAILMLIDSIEAASRTIDPPNRENFEAMVHRIVFVKLKQGQLDESGLTMDDLRIMTGRIAETLTKVHHKRIKYPWQNRAEEGADALPIPGKATEQDVAEELERIQESGISSVTDQPTEDL